MTIHPRSDWTAEPAADAWPLTPAEVEGVVVHYNGPAVPVSALTDPRAYLEAVRRYHTGKGWSDFAYNLAVDQTGAVWVGRGLRHRSAANGDTDTNRRYVAVLAIVGEGQKPTRAMLAGLRTAVRLTRTAYPKALDIRGHKDVRPGPTACPGPDLTDAIRTGKLEPRPTLDRSILLDAYLRDRRSLIAHHPRAVRRLRRALGMRPGLTGRYGGGVRRAMRARFVSALPLVASLRALADEASFTYRP